MTHPATSPPHAAAPDREIDPAAVDALFDRAHREVREGLLPSCQLALAYEGRIVRQAALGAVTHQGRPAPASADTLYVIFSCTKALTSSLAWLLVQDGTLDWDERVADIVPGFDTNGKEAVRVRHLLTHTAGFPYAPMPIAAWRDPEARAERYARWRLEWEPGSRMEYHATSSMWALADVIERRGGRPLREQLRMRVAEPLGIADLRLGLPPALHGRVADVVHVGEAMSPEALVKLGFPVNLRTEVTEQALVAFNEADARESGVPGGGGIATAAALALFYQGLLRDLGAHDGPRVWQRAVLAEATRVHSGDLLDPMLRRPANRGLGVVVAGTDPAFRGFGHGSSPRAFGHMGAGGQVAWADPDTGLSFAYLTNGCDRNPIRMARRGIGLSTRAAACVRA